MHVNQYLNCVLGKSSQQVASVLCKVEVNNESIIKTYIINV